MSPSGPWESAAIDLLTELAAGVETCRLYSNEHPRFDRARRRLTARIEDLWRLPVPEEQGPVDGSELEVAVVQRELFFQGRPFTRVGEQMGVIVRALSRHHVERIGFQPGVTSGEIARCLEFLAGSPLVDVPEFAHIVVGNAVSLSSMTGGGADARPLDLNGRIDVLSAAVRAVADDQPLPLPGVYRVVEQLDTEMQRVSDPIGLLAPLDDDGSWVTVHSHNTAALCLSLAAALGFDADRRHEIGIAAVLHDVGKFGIKDDLIQHDLDLTGTEWELNFNHPQIGLERLLMVHQAPEVACIVAFDHHLRRDGGGYPSLPEPRPPHPAAAMVAVAEATDIMLTVRVPRGTMDSAGVAHTLGQCAGDVFDPYLAGVMSAVLQVPRF